MTRAQATEYVSGTPTRNLPEHVAKKRKKTAPRPAYTMPAAAAPAAGPTDKAMRQTVGDIGALNSLRNRRLPAAGY